VDEEHGLKAGRFLKIYNNDKNGKQPYRLFESSRPGSPTLFFRSLARVDVLGEDGIAGPSTRGEAAGGGGRGGCGCAETTD
jgi:hypothetical protein